MQALIAAMGFGALLLTAAAGPANAAGPSACAHLTRLKLAHAAVVSATPVVAGITVQGFATPLHVTGPFCRVVGVSRPTPDSRIGFEVWLPPPRTWNRKYLQVGNGGFAGRIPYDEMADGLRRRYAVAATDDGHRADDRTADWALHHPEKVKDFAFRALKETTEAAKAIVKTYAGSAPRRSYFAGCSDGGREALIEAQRYPNDFDGIVAGAPADYWTRLLSAMAYVEQGLGRDPAHYLPATKLSMLERAALAQCGGGQGFIEDPLACRFDPASVQCRSGDRPDCLTEGEVETARRLYDGLPDSSTGSLIFPGQEPGAEAEPDSWGDWVVGPSRAELKQALDYRFAWGFFANMVFDDPALDLERLDVRGALDQADRTVGPLLNADNPDLSAFRGHGGKLIQYHGWNDPAIPPRSSIRYFDAVKARTGDPSGYYRLFMVPGMFHCGGGPGPSQADWIGALEAWVEQGRAPDSIVASKPDAPRSFTRVLHPYPQLASKPAR